MRRKLDKLAEKISPNKIGPTEQRRAQRIKQKLQDKGIGQDEAAKRGIVQATGEIHGGRGGGRNKGKEPQKRMGKASRSRSGSQSNES